jgi:hypothetical protein
MTASFSVGGARRGSQGPVEKDGHLDVAHHTLLFTWSRLNDFQDMGTESA